jgi:hypothetical protein
MFLSASCGWHVLSRLFVGLVGIGLDWPRFSSEKFIHQVNHGIHIDPHPASDIQGVRGS